MNSYNDNLHSSVVSSLNAQELELQNVEAKLEASMFSLYYAQGARITTAEELEITTAKYAFEKKVNEQAIIDSDLSTNVLESANNAKDYTSRSVSNTAVAAANVQIAANAILKLASDTGAIFSIINAADFDTDIYAQSQKAKVLMDDTAYLAEQASQHSMEASASIAEVTTTTLANKATVTDTSIKDLLAVVTTQFDNTTTLLATQSAALATANTKEKKAEGVLEDYSVAYEATEQAYELSNLELNLDLTVTTPLTIGDHDSYVVSFNPYVSAFQEQTSGTPATSDTAAIPPAPKDTNQPVESYNIMLVKNSSSGTFSMNDAEGILAGDFTDRYVVMSDEDIITIPENGKMVHRIVKEIYTSGTNTPVLKDSEGDDLELGQEYVIFVFAVFKTAYKKIINTFDDYLSAPSKMFVMQNQLNSAGTNTIIEKPVADENADTNPEYQVINFSVFKNPKYEVAYRCVFLPHNPDLVQGLLTVEGVENIENNILQLTKIEHAYGLEISNINTHIKLVQDTITGLQTKITQNEDKIDNAKTEASKTKLINQNKTLNTTLKEELEKLANLKTELKNLNSIKDTAIANIDINKHVQPGFFFNLTTAEKISAGSYTPAKPGGDTLSNYLLKSIEKIFEDVSAIEKLKTTDEDSENTPAATLTAPTGSDTTIENAKNLIAQVRGLRHSTLKDILDEPMDDAMNAAVKQFLQDVNQLLIDLLLIIDGYKYTSLQVTLAPETTDNFGNRLIGNDAYIPAIISVTNNTDETVNTQYINALSDFNRTPQFIYNDPYANTSKVVAYPKQTIIN